jgi:hypothetical protein
MKNVLFLLLAAAILVAPPRLSRAAGAPVDAAVTLHGACASAEGDAACSRCDVTAKEDIELPAGQGVLTWSCPRMAPGRYSVKVAVPFRLIPSKPAPALFSQLVTSFSGTIRDASGQVRLVPLQDSPVSLSWWGDATALMERTAQIGIDESAELEFELKVEDAAYYIPLQTQGPAFRDGKLAVEKAALVRLVRQPAADPDRSVDPGKPRDFDPAALAKLVPGKTTKAQVEALLGEPWRASEPDADEAEPGVWEYRGIDKADLYRVHIEFDEDGTATLVSRVSESTKETKDDIEKAPPHQARP